MNLGTEYEGTGTWEQGTKEQKLENTAQRNRNVKDHPGDLRIYFFFAFVTSFRESLSGCATGFWVCSVVGCSAGGTENRTLRGQR